MIADNDRERKMIDKHNSEDNKDKRGSVTFSKKHVMIHLETSERKKVFRQRKYVTIDAKLYTDILKEHGATSPSIQSSSEGRLDNMKDDNPAIYTNAHEGGLGRTGDEQTKDYGDGDLLKNKEDRTKKDYSSDSTHSVVLDDDVQTSSKSSMSTQMSDTIPGHWKSDKEYLSDESFCESETSSKEKNDKKMLSISDSEECDTDLEIDPDFGKVKADPSDAVIGKDVYLKYCERWNIVPQKVFLNGLTHRSLTVRNRSLGSSTIAPACEALKDNLRVERLNLDSADIKDSGCRNVAKMLIENICVSRVNLSNNDLGLVAAQHLGHVMAVTKYITHLNLSGNKFDDNCSWFLADGISTNETLESLDLSYNNLENISGKLIGKALVINKRLRNLNLSWNKLCGKGSVSIFHALMFNKTLERLDISWNGLGYEGSVALSKCLKKNRSLKEIDVSNNRIDWLGAPLIAVGLKKNGVLKKLMVGYNPLTTTGCMDLLEAASADTNGLSLLDATEISVVGEADLLAATISRKRKFTFLHGRILPTHDKLGQKQGREINPMVRIIEYLRLLGLRPLELMKSFHKTASYELPRHEFVDEIKRIGVKLHPHEIEALANSISAKGYDRNVINYRKLAVAVREVVEEERRRKIREREEWRQIKTYHEKILRRGTLNNVPIPRSSSLDARQKEKDFITVNALFTPLSSTSSIKSPQVNRKLSLCAPLDAVGSRSDLKTKKQVRTKKRRARKH